MRAEIISVGTELLLGHTVNADAAHVARELSALGVDLLQVQTLGDNGPRLEAALREALGRAEVVITTGGLGPAGHGFLGPRGECAVGGRRRQPGPSAGVFRQPSHVVQPA